MKDNNEKNEQPSSSSSSSSAVPGAPAAPLMIVDQSLADDPKATADYTEEVDELLSRVPDFLLKGSAGLEELTEAILILEKKARQASESASVSKLSCKLLEVYKEQNLWDSTIDFASTLCRKRGQLKRVISDIVALGTCWIDETKDRTLKLRLIRTLSSICEGKIFVEVEKARLIRRECEILEADGKIVEAANLLQAVPVEVCSGMDFAEKTSYILEQMRLQIEGCQDYARLQIISKKINVKFLEQPEFQDTKLRYYQFMIRYHLEYEKDYLNAAKAFWSCFKTPVVESRVEDWKKFLSNYAILLLIAPHSTESVQLVQNLKNNEAKKLVCLPEIEFLISSFLSTEISNWPLQSYEQEIRVHEIFNVPDRWDTLRCRFIQHNILILSNYYSRISYSRAAALLNITKDEIESKTAELVNEGIIYARMDRPAGIIVFNKPKSDAEKLDVWVSSITELLTIIQETTHLISNDRMVHEALEKRRQLIERSKAS